jgi:hypothetical protein
MLPSSGQLKKNKILVGMVALYCRERVCEGNSCTEPTGRIVEES